MIDGQCPVWAGHAGILNPGKGNRQDSVAASRPPRMKPGNLTDAVCLGQDKGLIPQEPSLSPSLETGSIKAYEKGSRLTLRVPSGQHQTWNRTWEGDGQLGATAPTTFTEGQQGQARVALMTEEEKLQGWGNSATPHRPTAGWPLCPSEQRGGAHRTSRRGGPLGPISRAAAGRQLSCHTPPSQAPLIAVI